MKSKPVSLAVLLASAALTALASPGETSSYGNQCASIQSQGATLCVWWEDYGACDGRQGKDYASSQMWGSWSKKGPFGPWGYYQDTFLLTNRCVNEGAPEDRYFTELRFQYWTEWDPVWSPNGQTYSDVRWSGSSRGFGQAESCEMHVKSPAPGGSGTQIDRAVPCPATPPYALYLVTAAFESVLPGGTVQA